MLEEFLSAMARLISEKGQSSLLNQLSSLYFTSIDSNNDGFVDEGEFVAFVDLIGWDEEVSATIFITIDDNKDGWVSWEEYRDASVQFFSRRDCAREDMMTMWGPLSR